MQCVSEACYHLSCRWQPPSRHYLYWRESYDAHLGLRFQLLSKLIIIVIFLLSTAFYFIIVQINPIQADKILAVRNTDSGIIKMRNRTNSPIAYKACELLLQCAIKRVHSKRKHANKGKFPAKIKIYSEHIESHGRQTQSLDKWFSYTIHNQQGEISTEATEIDMWCAIEIFRNFGVQQLRRLFHDLLQD